MRLLVFVSVMATFLGPILAQSPGVESSRSTPPTIDGVMLEAYVDGIVTAHMRQHDTPGVTVGIVLDGRPLFAKGYGFSDIEQDKPVLGDETLFRIGSVSKTFIWSSVLILVERGQLDLDTDVNQYLNGVEIPSTFDEPVSLNHLMAHRAGFENTLAVFTHADDTEMSLTDALNRDMPARVFPPGTRTSYSNWGSTLASKIVADVSGKPYERFVHEEILAPLGMTNTTMKGPGNMPADLRKQLAIGYEMKNGAPKPAEFMQIGPYAPAGAIASSAADMARWMLVHLGGGQYDGVHLMTPETHELMWTRAFPDRLSGADLAHGFMTRPYYGYATYGHGGATSAFYTNMLLVPELGLGIFVSQNATGDRGLVAELPDLIVQRLATADHGIAETTTDEALAERASDYAGSFMNNRRSFTRFEKLFASAATASVAPGDDGSVVVSSSGNTVRYAPVVGADDTYQDRYGNRIVFGRDDSGRVRYYTGAMGVHSMEKIGGLESPNSLIAVIVITMLFSITTWLGVLWRRGVPTQHTGVGAALNVADAAATVVYLAFLISTAWAIAAISSATAADFVNYPPTSFTVMRGIGLLLFLVCVAAALSLWPAWRSSGWTVFRKVHHTFFVLSLVAVAFMMFRWNVVFASTAI